MNIMKKSVKRMNMGGMNSPMGRGMGGRGPMGRPGMPPVMGGVPAQMPTQSMSSVAAGLPPIGGMMPSMGGVPTQMPTQSMATQGMKKGGMAASKRGDGIAQRGKTKGRMV